MKKKVA
jgi:hypothetical protein